MAKAKRLELNEDEFPDNSKPSRKTAPMRDVEIIEEGAMVEEPKKKIAQGVVIKKRRSITRAIADFFSEDAREVGSYVFLEVLMPAAKTLIQDIVTQGIERALYGDEGGPRKSSRDRTEGRVSYGKYYSKDDRSPRKPARRERFDLEEIYFPRPKDANDVLEELCDQLEKYEQVTVAEYLELAGIDEIDWTHSKWGWTSLRTARVAHTRNGWMIMFPDPEDLRS